MGARPKSADPPIKTFVRPCPRPLAGCMPPDYYPTWDPRRGPTPRLPHPNCDCGGHGPAARLVKRACPEPHNQTRVPVKKDNAIRFLKNENKNKKKQKKNKKTNRRAYEISHVRNFARTKFNPPRYEISYAAYEISHARRTCVLNFVRRRIQSDSIQRSKK